VFESDPPESWRPVPIDVVASALDPFPVRRVFDWMLAHPVPPFDTPRTPVTSLARFTNAVDTTPAVALRNPESVPMVSEFDTTAFDDEAVLVTARVVEVAFVRRVLFESVVEERVAFPVTESTGAVTAPVALIVVVAVAPIARVFPERLVVEAFVRLVCPEKVLVLVNVLFVYVFGMVVEALVK
jgi:hypothetical protein